MTTHPFGYETVGPGGYATGEDETGAFLPMRPMLPASTQQPARALSPAALAASMARRIPVPAPVARAAQQAYAPAASGLSPTAQQQVASMIEAYLQARVPYGDVPPRPQPDEAMFPMGLGSVTLTSATGGAGLLSAQPQRAFRGERLVLSVFRSAGAVGIPTIINDFSIGDYKQLVGGGSLPVEVFASDAFGVRLMLDASIPGVLYRVSLSALAPIPAGEQIIIAGAVIGRAGEAAAR